MLTISRHVGETIVIGDPAKPIGFIKVYKVVGTQVYLSIELPRDIPINRQEVADAKVKEMRNNPRVGG